jgi:predicted class III extradiol MEMO1 family dioxygenase
MPIQNPDAEAAAQEATTGATADADRESAAPDPASATEAKPAQDPGGQAEAEPAAVTVTPPVDAASAGEISTGGNEGKNGVHATDAPDPAGEDEGGDGPDPSEQYPMLRPLDAYPMDVRDASGGVAKVLVLADPSGIAPSTVKLPPLGAAVIELCDGTRTREQICADFSKQYRTPLSLDALNGLLQKLDDALLLDSTRFRLHCARLFAEFAGLPTRPAQFAGRHYPADLAELKQALSQCFGPPHGPPLPTLPAEGQAQVSSQPMPRAILAPTVDLSRAGPAYGWSYRALLDTPRLPSLIVLLGCDHAAHDAIVTLTRKDFETPLGLLKTDVALVDALVQDLSARAPELGELLTRDESHHRGEHSLEMQVLLLRYILDWRAAHGLPTGLPDNAEPRILPILCGSLHDLAANPPSRDGKLQPHQTTQILDEFVIALQRRVGERQGSGETILWLAGSDLAHVGPRFGDAEVVSESDRDSLERRDQETLKPVLHGDAVGFLGEIRRERDRRHIYGLGTIYLFLSAARPSAGKLRCYAQCDAESGSFVSLASLWFS